MRKKNKTTKKRELNSSCLYIAFVALIACMYFIAVLPHIDDTAYNEVVENNVLDVSDMNDSDSEFDQVEGNSLIISPGKGLKLFSGQVSLQEGDALSIHFTALNKSEKKAKLTVDLYGENFDDPYDEFTVKIPSGETEVSKEIAFYRNEHPGTCEIRLFTSDDKELEIKGFSADRMVMLRDANKGLLTAVYCIRILMIIAAASLALCLVKSFRGRKDDTYRTGAVNARNALLYIFTALVVTLLLLILYKNADITAPLVYAGGDEMGVYYYAKTIDQNGISLANSYSGGMSGGDLFDYPYSDSLSFAIVRIIGLFTDNPYLIINLFYFTNLYLIALIAVAVSRKLGLNRASALVTGVLFAFSPFFQMRYPHMWLTAYYMLPVTCMLSINIIKGKIPEEENGRRKKNMFWSGMFLAFLCSFTGMYYAYFACAIIAAAMVIRIISIQGKGLKNELYPIAFIGSSVLGVLVNVVPNLIYWILNGANPSGELSIRYRGDAETYGLKLVQLILPRQGHRIGLFNRIADGYARNYPLVNENNTAAIGVIASLGFLISLLLLFYERNRYKEISWLNLATFIIGTIGGIGSIISVAVVIPMRCYNRMSLIIMFLSLALVGFLLDRFRDKKGTALALCVSLCVLAIGVFDQTVSYEPYDDTSFKDTVSFMDQIENELDSGDSVFVLPYLSWPSSNIAGSYGLFSGYIETENVHWSYGAMQGREEAEWQKHVAGCKAKEMIDKIRYAGYSGVYIDRGLYEAQNGENTAEELASALTEEIGKKPLVSSGDGDFFWKF